ncbi:MAG: ferredoxin family protein, partial [Acidobacteria bacterium]|nr:ferredoxin family protein [Acidobacteriota bacterium]
YKGGPINGDVVREADLQREKMKVDISALLGGDIYAALRQRSADATARFSKERDEKRALDERRRCLTKLQQDLGIPPEVLAALPSLDDIHAKTAKALAAAEGKDPS